MRNVCTVEVSLQTVHRQCVGVVWPPRQPVVVLGQWKIQITIVYWDMPGALHQRGCSLQFD